MGRPLPKMSSDHNIHAPTVSSGPTTSTTSDPNTSSPQTLATLIAQKESAEAELSALGSVLDSHNVDMSTPLTTADGFPRADLDVAQIRTTRARIVRLRNDYKALMGRVEEKVLEGFAAGKVGVEGVGRAVNGVGAGGGSVGAGAAVDGAANGGSGGAAAERASSIAQVPFARVNAVVEGSPAASAGLVVGDKVTKFGDADWRNHERLGKVARVVQENENVSLIWSSLLPSSTDLGGVPVTNILCSEQSLSRCFARLLLPLLPKTWS